MNLVKGIVQWLPFALTALNIRNPLVFFTSLQNSGFYSTLFNARHVQYVLTYSSVLGFAALEGGKRDGK
jgi:hypothetical protein